MGSFGSPLFPFVWLASMSEEIQKFFDAVLPSQGLFCVVGLMHDRTKPPVVEYFDMGSGAAYAEIAKLDSEDREVYFGCASYVDSSKPKDVRNIQAIKSFYVDIDCGKDGCYSSKREALTELGRFCNEMTLPMPTLVDSGFGVHAYWTLTHSIDYNTWKPIANAFKKKAIEKAFIIDPVVTADGARILRVPGTTNKKRLNNHKLVVLKGVKPPMELDDFKSIIGFIDLGRVENVDKDPVMEALLKSSKSYKFSRIHRKNIEEVSVHENVEEEVPQPDGSRVLRLVKKKVSRIAGCPQLAYCVANRATLPNGMWMGALSIAWYCVDQAEAVEAVSKDHRDYDFANSCYHAARMHKPRTCEGFRELEMPHLCNSCIHNGKIHTPIVLGAMIEEAKPDDNVIEVMHEVLGEKQTIEIPDDYPWPWFRPKNGGVAMRVQEDADDPEAATEVAVYKRDMWVKSRSKDGKQELMTIVLRLPHDGLAEFTAPVASLYKLESLRELLAQKGVHEAADDTKLKLLRKYLSAWQDKLQESSEANKARTQFGWHDYDTRFVIGNREIDKDGNIHVATIAQSIDNIARNYVKRGSLEEWQRVIKGFSNPGNEARAFSLFSALGAPLYKFIGEGSILLHLTNVASGVGKSTCLKIGNSVWGSPNDTLLIEADTVNAKIHRAGILNNLPPMIDEITNMAPDKSSDLAFQINQGRGKNRMDSSANNERINDTSWCTIAQSSGNNSIFDTLRLHKSNVEGELMRVIDIGIPQDNSMSKSEADDLFVHVLPKNYGHAGEIFMRYVVPNKHNVVERLKEVQKEFDQIGDLGSKERFYSACFAAAFVAAEISNKIGIFDIPIEPVRKWAINLLKDVRKAVSKSTYRDDASYFNQIVSKYWNETLNHILTVNPGADVDNALGYNTAALKPVIGAMKGRYEVSANRLYVSSVDFDAWMSSNRIPSVQVLNGLKQTGTLVFDGEMNLGRDTVVYKTGAIPVYGFDTRKLEIG